MQRSLLLISLFISLFTVGCNKQPYTYVFLVQHPDVLQEEFLQCQNFGTNSHVSCAVVMQAGKDFQALVDERSNDPLGFGQKIQQAELELSKLAGGAYDLQMQKIQMYFAVIRATSRAN